ncbi:TlyA family RNA methyltransferase [Ammoniphilus resinae]|uniref:23S rRNA (Cytidine1920-2'-O)/16S rRNA (Cytidine1409-2'-O)-methyltransferase n=1 Tax=Ammoniphilus resinae TaxID=861532 RepID=A0ABS4GV99_9BACL|nr:TlyA family RNA methyltransferase [Ammoniphilus resinae]MBP1934193.1 23S rRNA (cytidine1920-2'-O)/16S rRNA (cytidine1409-2'-O)-methyltransferase [Ammoniphilus resinae]
MSKKQRIDVLLVEQGFFPSREKAQRAIMAGLVFVGEERCDKPGVKIDETLPIKVKGDVHPYVSRGGLKLEKAIKVFDLKLEDAVVLDIGSSTGGFTDCALQNGAKQVYAIDVGYGQLDWKLRSDSRVIVMERTNFRHLEPEQLAGETPTFATIDVSFISLRIILPVLIRFFSQGGQVMALVKPQFEAGREQVGKNGIVRDPRIHEQVLWNMVEFARGLNYKVKGLDFSPITGGEGNIEFLLHLTWGDENPETLLTIEDIKELVNRAHNKLE